jgi:hypothetical protein
VSDEKPREIAMRILQRGAGGDFVEDRLEAELAHSRLSPPDRHLCQELAYGIVRWQATLDWLIGRKTTARAQKPMLQEPPAARPLPDLLARSHPRPCRRPRNGRAGPAERLHSQAGFVNAVLRGYCASSTPQRAPAGRAEDEQPHLGYSHPEWLVAAGKDGGAPTARPVDGVE